MTKAGPSPSAAFPWSPLVTDTCSAKNTKMSSIDQQEHLGQRLTLLLGKTNFIIDTKPGFFNYQKFACFII